MGAVFALFAGIYYWIGKIIGNNYNEILGQIHFWSLFLGVNITFFPMHFLGLAGHPRRIPDYPDAYTSWNKIASYGSIISVISIIIFFYTIYKVIINNKNELSFNYWGEIMYYTLKYNQLTDPILNKDIYTFNNIKKIYLNSQNTTSLEWSINTPPRFHEFNQKPIISL